MSKPNSLRKKSGNILNILRYESATRGTYCNEQVSYTEQLKYANGSQEKVLKSKHYASNMFLTVQIRNTSTIH